MNPTYSAAAEEYREKVQAFLAEKLPPNWKGIGALTGEALDHFVFVRIPRSWLASRVWWRWFVRT
jgi:hypothetical protein